MKCASKCMIPICTESAVWRINLEYKQSICKLNQDYVAVWSKLETFR